MKLVQFCSILGILILYAVNGELYFAIYKLDCIDEKDTKYVENITCLLKTIGRGITVLTSLSDLVKPLNKINCNAACLQKSSSNTYRTVIFNYTFEICSIVNDPNPSVLTFSLPLLTKFAPSLVHKCPYQGKQVGVRNLPIDLSLLPLVQMANMPKGDYRVDMTFYDADHNYIHWLKLYGAIQQKSKKRTKNNKFSNE